MAFSVYHFVGCEMNGICGHFLACSSIPVYMRPLHLLAETLQMTLSSFLLFQLSVPTVLKPQLHYGALFNAVQAARESM